MQNQSVIFNTEFESQIVPNPKFNNIYSYSIEPQSCTIIINTASGFSMVRDNKIKNYNQRESNPFKVDGKGIRLSSYYYEKNLIAVVPCENFSLPIKIKDKQENKVYSMNCVYIYDLEKQQIVFEKDFHYPVQSLKFDGKYIIVSNSKRVIIYDYQRDTDRRKNYTLDDLFSDYKSQNLNHSIRYFQTHCACTYNCDCGKFKTNTCNSLKIAFVKNSGKTISIYDTQLDYLIQFEEKNFKFFCLSQSGQYLALVSEGGINIQIKHIKTKQIYTTFRRGKDFKKVLCMGFINNWFGIASESPKYATLHLFKIQASSVAQQSRFRRYFNTFSNTIDFYVENEKLKMFTLQGGYYELLNVKKINEIHAEEVSKTISPNAITLWKD